MVKVSFPPTYKRGAALRIFPVLRRWNLKPRIASIYPIGGKPTDKDKKREPSDRDKTTAVARTMSTIYHDLGVIAFDGCTFAQTQKIGDILAQIVFMGGPAAIMSRCRPTGASAQKMLAKMYLPDDFDDSQGGLDFSREVTQLRTAATSYLNQYLVRQKLMDDPLSQLKEVTCMVEIPDTRIGVYRDTVNGRRLLPCNVDWHVYQPRNGPVFSLVASTVGTGAAVGRIVFSHHLENGQNRQTAMRGLKDVINAHAAGEAQHRRASLDPGYMVCVMLYDLERQTWAPRMRGFNETADE